MKFRIPKLTDVKQCECGKKMIQEYTGGMRPSMPPCYDWAWKCFGGRRVSSCGASEIGKRNSMGGGKQVSETMEGCFDWDYCDGWLFGDLNDAIERFFDISDCREYGYPCTITGNADEIIIRIPNPRKGAKQ